MQHDRTRFARTPLAGTPLLFQNEYTWLVFVSAMDIMMTWVVLHRGGREANAIAEWVIRLAGLPGMVVYKFALMVIVILVCEAVGRRQPLTGRRLSRWAVALSAVPVVLAFLQLWIAR